MDGHFAPSFVAAGSDARYLLLVTSDACKYSSTAAEQLVSAIGQLPLAISDRVLLISTNGRRIPDSIVPALESRRIRYQVLQVKRVAAFTEETGVSATPSILVLDSNLRVRFIANELSDLAMEGIGSLFSVQLRR
jgi:hypothetical protein